jgi:hypothetical protein
MKKIGTILILILVAAVVGISGCTDNGSGNNTTKNYSANGYTFDYPSNWTVNDTNAANGTIIIFNGTKYDNTTSMAILKIPLNGSTATEMLNLMQSGFASSGYNVLSNKTITYQNTTAYEYVYTYNDTNKNTVKMNVIFFVKGDNVYVIGIQTLESDFDTLKSKFETFKNSFQIQ